MLVLAFGDGPVEVTVPRPTSWPSPSTPSPGAGVRAVRRRSSRGRPASRRPDGRAARQRSSLLGERTVRIELRSRRTGASTSEHDGREAVEPAADVSRPAAGGMSSSRTCATRRGAARSWPLRTAGGRRSSPPAARERGRGGQRRPQPSTVEAAAVAAGAAEHRRVTPGAWRAAGGAPRHAPPARCGSAQAVGPSRPAARSTSASSASSSGGAGCPGRRGGRGTPPSPGTRRARRAPCSARRAWPCRSPGRRGPARRRARRAAARPAVVGQRGEAGLVARVGRGPRRVQVGLPGRLDEEGGEAVSRQLGRRGHGLQRQPLDRHVEVGERPRCPATRRSRDATAAQRRRAPGRRPGRLRTGRRRGSCQPASSAATAAG